MNRKMIIVFALAAAAVFIAASAADASDAASPDSVLFDYGNGKTVWKDAVPGGTVSAVLERAAADAGILFSISGGTVSVDGRTSAVIGGASVGGSFTSSGTTGATASASWIVYKWTGEWTVASLSDTYASGSLALGFYPSGVVPAETPVNKTSWTMVRGDAAQSGSQTAVLGTDPPAEFEWMDSRGGVAGAYSCVLGADGRVFVKFGTSSGMSASKIDAALRCYGADGTLQWSFEFPGILYYETSTPLIVGDSIYVTSGYGYIFKVPIKAGPGINNANVTTFDGRQYSADDVVSKKYAIPYSTGAALTGETRNTGAGSLVCDSGAIYCTASNGMAYCFSMDLKLLWSYQLGGSVYYLSPAVKDGYFMTGAMNGSLYVLDSSKGSLIASEKVYTKTVWDSEYGLVAGITCLKVSDGYRLMFSVSDGRGMNSTVGGIGIYSFDGTSLSKVLLNTQDFGMTCNYLAGHQSDGFSGAYFVSSKGLFRIDTDGKHELLNNTMGEIHAGPVIVNGSRIYLAGYTAHTANYITDMGGKLITTFVQPSGADNYCVSPVTVLDGRTYVGNDSGVYCYAGAFSADSAPSGKGFPLGAVLIAALALVIVAAFYVLKRRMGENPIRILIRKIGEDGGSHTRRNKRRLAIMLAAGAVIAFVLFTLCLAVGSTATFSFTETYSLLFSSISKGGQNLTDSEILVYYSRLPRTLVAFAVGIGLSVAGAIYQAIIRNPLVDPYIMGVSSGAGTAAVAVIAFNFTFFGLFPAHSIYLTAFAAIVGGVIAFFSTMIIAERAGGSSANFVLAGVVVGLAFSAVQTLMLTMAGHRVSSALSWLFGSFSNVSWNHLWIVLIPVIAMSFASLLWAKELNLVLLGEDQATQMGLDVRKFNRGMLILASVLTSVCVAFVGIIGFVGLVIPHLCRMILGGDHRLVLPTSMALGCSLMMAADFISRTALSGIELPVGAITTVVGVPVFAYLLIRKGRMYDG